jgi:hypothetical protein
MKIIGKKFDFNKSVTYFYRIKLCETLCAPFQTYLSDKLWKMKNNKTVPTRYSWDLSFNVLKLILSLSKNLLSDLFAIS